VLKKFAATLSPLEKERAARFRFEKHRDRFIAGRGLLRATLGKYLQMQPSKLDFLYSERGKPGLSAALAGADLKFNLAHTGDLALVAVTRVAPVGVDVERIRKIKDVEDLVERFFSPRETRVFKKLSDAEKPPAFFNLWTRKEALLKATGEGIGQALSTVEVSFLPGEPARLVNIAGGAEHAAQWSLHEFSPAKGYVGATAIQARDIVVRNWKW
jgi:4'-phosphopantetheinyl transferase